VDVTTRPTRSAHGPFLLGIDCGQTEGKAALFDVDGREIAVATAATRTSSPHPRWVERDMEEMWQQIAAAVRQVLTQVRPEAELLAVGVCGHNDGLYAVNDDLRPVRPAILAIDSRAHRYAAATALGETAKGALTLTGQVPYSGSPASLYAWMRDAEPQTFKDVRWALHAKDWIRLKLTGAVATDPSEASASFTDVTTQTWSPAALDLYGLGGLEEALPPIVGSAHVAGHVTAEAAALTGLAEGTPVATGAHDVDAAAIGIGAANPGTVSMIFGTFSINQIVADQPVMDPRWQARSFVRPGQWLHMCTSPAGASNLDWAIRRFGPWKPGGEPDPEQAIGEAKARNEQGPTPTFVPYLYGSPHGAGPAAAWVGLRGWHGRGDILHAVLEAVVFNHRHHLEALGEAFALNGPVRLCGGGARSSYWAQMLADAINLPVDVTDADEAGARGAALLAGAAAGTFTSLDDAIERSVRVLRHFDPQTDRVLALEHRYRRYQDVVAALATLQTDEEENDQ